uniref:Calcium-transporting ATPase n=1 Tax=Gossypium raimondii TaxID=29730 RepID=A0A0D2PFQ5_GOSRA|nr:hypothetical protein B456_007G277600 [Gossypium raimondii]
MSLRHRNTGYPEPAMSDGEDTPIVKCQHRRWRSVFAAIYSARIFVSLYKKIINKKQILRSLSYIALDVHDSDSSDDRLPSLSVDQKTLTEVVREKSLGTLSKLGGVKQIAASLETDEKDGISTNEADLAHRVDVFGANRYQKPPKKSFFSFVYEAFKDTTIIILLVCAVLSLGFGIKQHGITDGGYDGGSIIIAVFLVVAVSAVSNFKQNRQFEKLSKESRDIKVEVVRDGRRQFISVFEVVVGDVVCLKIGDQIPADGLFLDGHSLKVDESSMTGESDHVEINGSNNPFVLSGTKVTNGFGSMLVTSVGMNTAWGKMMSSINSELDEETPLQARLNKLTSAIGKIGLTVAVLVLAVLLIRYFTGNTKDDQGNKEYIRGKTKFDSMMNSVVEIISAAITIVVVAIPEGLPLAVTLTLAYSMKQMMADQAMVRKLSACETMGSATTICTDKTDLGMNLDDPKQNYELIQVEAFNSEKKRSGVLIRRNSENGGATQVHWKGAAEMILAMCSQYYDRSGAVKAIDEEERVEMGKIIEDMAAKSLRCIAFAHTKYPIDNERVLQESGLILLGLVGLKDPCRPGVRTAVEACINAGVNIKMITGDNIFTAKAIATECGILQPNEDMSEAVIEGVQFRNYSPEERMAKINRICVMARSSPFDKLLMVQCLKQNGHVVAVTGDGTNDAPALKEADIGLSMGIQGTEVAKESSDIIILDDNFTSVVTVLRWGRCVFNNIQKFIQFQLTVNIAALVINFIAAISSGEVPLTAVQLLWVNLIMDTFGALALATERPTNDLMTKPPVGRSKPLISNIMWRNLIAQALYQVAVLLTLQFRGKFIFDVDEKVKNTLIFNTFVLCQVVNEFNARKLEKKNIFQGLHKNKLFLGIIAITIILQVVMVEFLKRFANTQRLNWGQWGTCIGIAALSWPLGWLVKWIPA